jgi:DNA-entry nuclease
LVKYEIVDGNYLYNRCHLIGYQLAGENANVKNLITGTRYLNVTGMLPFEDMVAKYVNETDNHVLYRVTPIFSGDNLLADGVLMEAKSVEDNGEGICFNVFCYNVQPGIAIDYATGDSTLATITTTAEPSSATNQEQEQTPTTSAGKYAVNAKNGKIHIVGACPATKDGDNAMKQPVYFDTYEAAEAYSISIAPNQDKRNCGNCW